ncbi:anaerobic ribonucleoside-triphosphate reductase activating protein, partial [Enterocloster bolteae]|nr:anaerobic ribonucleoside-triphosphate reductase activating protein [Enterocloster bolteae]
VVLVPGIYSDFTKDEMMAFAELVRPYVGQVSLRGIDY